MISTDVCVIGGGVVGTNVLRVLSKYHIHSVLLESNTDIGSGITKGNGGVVHSGYDAHYGTLKAILNVKGASMYAALSKELDFPYKNLPTMTVAFNQQEREKLEELLANGIKNKVPSLRIIEKEEMLKIEPHVNPEAICALLVPSAGITDPYEVAHACAENAISNGAEIFLRNRVLSIEKTEDGFVITTNKDVYHAKAVINCAGVYGDLIAKMAGSNDYEIQQRHGTLLIIDKAIGFELNAILFPVPGQATKGMAAIPACAGNIIIGSTATMKEDKEDKSFTREEVDHLISSAAKLVPELRRQYIIRVFNGLRPVEIHSDNDFVVEESKGVEGFFNCIGIQSPGVAAAPAIAEYVVELLSKRIPLKRKDNYIATRKGIVDFSKLSKERQKEMVDSDNRYGNVICRCELVTEAEILDAIHRPCGATTLDGVKRRTRAGMGRCQGGFCQPRIVEILHRELHLDYTKILLEEEGSEILMDLDGEV
jgi:glycerol-3-phosphate dehydrogenase